MTGWQIVKQIQVDKDGDDFLIRSATYVTTSDDSHSSRVSSIKALPVSDDGLTGLEEAAMGSLPIFQVNPITLLSWCHAAFLQNIFISVKSPCQMSKLPAKIFSPLINFLGSKITKFLLYLRRCRYHRSCCSRPNLPFPGQKNTCSWLRVFIHHRCIIHSLKDRISVERNVVSNDYLLTTYFKQVVTVEEDGGKLIVWTVLDSQHDADTHLGIFTLLITTSVSLSSNQYYLDMETYASKALSRHLRKNFKSCMSCLLVLYCLV